MKRILKNWKDLEVDIRWSGLMGGDGCHGDWATWFIEDCTIPLREWNEWTDDERDEYLTWADNSHSYPEDVALALDIATRTAPKHKSCAHCNGHPRLEVIGASIGSVAEYYIECLSCGILTKIFPNKFDAWAAWDRRVSE